MSAQKQCPKCGEKNPAEAVMCWACYTSLSGGGMAAPAGAGPVGGAIAVGTLDDAGEKKKIEPKQMAIIGVGLLVALGFGVKTMMGSGAEESDDSTFIAPAPNKGGDTSPPPTTQTPSTSAPAPATGGPAPEAPSSGPVPPERFPYSMIAAPNPRYPTATIAILPTQNDVNESQARGLATFAHRQLDKVKKFDRVEIFVFNDPKSAQEFATFQNERKGAPMTSDLYDSPRLAAVWPKSQVRYLSSNNRVSYTSPMRNPTAFWKSQDR